MKMIFRLLINDETSKELFPEFGPGKNILVFNNAEMINSLVGIVDQYNISFISTQEIKKRLGIINPKFDTKYNGIEIYILKSKSLKAPLDVDIRIDFNCIGAQSSKTIDKRRDGTWYTFQDGFTVNFLSIKEAISTTVDHILQRLPKSQLEKNIDNVSDLLNGFSDLITVCRRSEELENKYRESQIAIAELKSSYEKLSQELIAAKDENEVLQGEIVSLNDKLSSIKSLLNIAP